jgi:ribosomally synthesized peptide (two-chain TOMM family)
MNLLDSSSPTYQQFLEYRAVIVQAIAVAWHDEAFREHLKANPKAALLERFNYRYPFNLDLRVQFDSSAWTPQKNGGWTTLENNALEVVLPPAPAQREQYSIALAAYNAKHISVIGHAAA